MKKFATLALMLVLVLVVAGCNRGQSAQSIQQENEGRDPAQERLEGGDPQAIMEDTKNKFSRDDVTFYTYRIRDGKLNMRERLDNEEIEQELVEAFVQAYQGTEANELELELTGKGTYNIPLDQEVTDYQEYFTPEE